MNESREGKEKNKKPAGGGGGRYLSSGGAQERHSVPLLHRHGNRRHVTLTDERVLSR